MNYTINARMEDRRNPCNLCYTPTYHNDICAHCAAMLRLGKTIKTSTASYRQRDGALQIKPAGHTKFVAA